MNDEASFCKLDLEEIKFEIYLSLRISVYTVLLTDAMWSFKLSFSSKITPKFLPDLLKLIISFQNFKEEIGTS